MQPFNYFDPRGRGETNFNQQYDQAYQRAQQNTPQANRIRMFQMMNIEDEQRQNAMITDAKQAKTLIANGDTKNAMELLQDRAQQIQQLGGNAKETQEVYNALRAGRPQDAMQMIDNFLMISSGADLAPRTSTTDNRDADSKKFDRLQELRASYGEDSKQVAEYEKLIGLTQDRKMSSALEKQIIKAQDDYFTNDQQARQMEVLASDIKRMDIGGGLKSSTSENFKAILGSQDEVTDLRRRFNAIRTSQAVVNLPPGVASDKDIELALKGFPAENANASQIISFLNGQQKLARINADFNRFKAEWFSDKKQPSGLLSAWTKELEKSRPIEATQSNTSGTPKSTNNVDLSSLSDAELEAMLREVSQ